MSKQAKDILITALLSSGIFLFILSAKLGFILFYLSTLPLLSIGLEKSPKTALKSAILATVVIALLTSSPSAGLIFLIIFGLPCWYVCDMALRYYDIKLNQSLPPIRLWYPIVLITMHLAIYSCILLAIITAIFTTQDANLPQQLTQIINSQIIDLKKDYELNVEIATESISFLLCGILAWMWGIFLLGHALFVNKILAKKKIAKRPNFALTPFFMPHWLLTLIGICALASLIGGESIRFLGKSSLIILLLPYFFQGTAMLHSASKNWANRRILLFFFYITIAALFWPALIVAGVALWHHIKILNKHLSSKKI